MLRSLDILEKWKTILCPIFYFLCSRSVFNSSSCFENLSWNFWNALTNLLLTHRETKEKSSTAHVAPIKTLACDSVKWYSSNICLQLLQQFSAFSPNVNKFQIRPNSARTNPEKTPEKRYKERTPEIYTIQRHLLSPLL